MKYLDISSFILFLPHFQTMPAQTFDLNNPIFISVFTLYAKVHESICELKYRLPRDRPLAAHPLLPVYMQELGPAQYDSFTYIDTAIMGFCWLHEKYRFMFKYQAEILFQELQGKTDAIKREIFTRDYGEAEMVLYSKVGDDPQTAPCSAALQGEFQMEDVAEPNDGIHNLEQFEAAERIRLAPLEITYAAARNLLPVAAGAVANRSNNRATPLQGRIEYIPPVPNRDPIPLLFGTVTCAHEKDYFKATRVRVLAAYDNPKGALTAVDTLIPASFNAGSHLSPDGTYRETTYGCSFPRPEKIEVCCFYEEQKMTGKKEFHKCPCRVKIRMALNDSPDGLILRGRTIVVRNDMDVPAGLKKHGLALGEPKNDSTFHSETKDENNVVSEIRLDFESFSTEDLYVDNLGHLHNPTKSIFDFRKNFPGWLFEAYDRFLACLPKTYTREYILKNQIGKFSNWLKSRTSNEKLALAAGRIGDGKSFLDAVARRVGADSPLKMPSNTSEEMAAILRRVSCQASFVNEIPARYEYGSTFDHNCVGVFHVGNSTGEFEYILEFSPKLFINAIQTDTLYVDGTFRIERAQTKTACLTVSIVDASRKQFCVAVLRAPSENVPSLTDLFLMLMKIRQELIAKGYLDGLQFPPRRGFLGTTTKRIFPT